MPRGERIARPAAWATHAAGRRFQTRASRPTDGEGEKRSRDGRPRGACGALLARAAGAWRGDPCRAGTRPGPRPFRVADRGPCGGRDRFAGSQGRRRSWFCELLSVAMCGVRRQRAAYPRPRDPDGPTRLLRCFIWRWSCAKPAASMQHLNACRGSRNQRCGDATCSLSRGPGSDRLGHKVADQDSSSRGQE